MAIGSCLYENEKNPNVLGVGGTLAVFQDDAVHSDSCCLHVVGMTVDSRLNAGKLVVFHDPILHDCRDHTPLERPTLCELVRATSHSHYVPSLMNMQSNCLSP